MTILRSEFSLYKSPFELYSNNNYLILVYKYLPIWAILPFISGDPYVFDLSSVYLSVA